MFHVQPSRYSGRCSLSLSHRLWFGDVFTLATRLRYPKKHMNRFEQIRKTLLSVSKEKRNYERALAEWEYRGDFYVNETSDMSSRSPMRKAPKPSWSGRSASRSSALSGSMTILGTKSQAEGRRRELQATSAL